ncbi:MAG: 50S ribosomal protein L4 [Bacteroidales bacterium]|nr:50S ribosomal protein L4 [Bacteroidales bacterium]
MELEVYNIKGQKTDRKIELDEKIFCIEPNDHAIYLDVKQYMANNRQGTHSAREKSQMTGSTRKLKRQKGTGGARAGSIKNPLYKGGARVFGPRPRDYDFKLNKKVKRLARMSAFSYKIKDNSIFVVEDFTFESPKTKNAVGLLKDFSISDKKTLLVIKEADKNIVLSSRNLKKLNVCKASNINTYEILDSSAILLTESSIEEIKKVVNN